MGSDAKKVITDYGAVELPAKQKKGRALTGGRGKGHVDLKKGLNSISLRNGEEEIWGLSSVIRKESPSVDRRETCSRSMRIVTEKGVGYSRLGGC